MTKIPEAVCEAWRRFQWFYRESEPYGGEGDGNSRLIQSERDSCSYLAGFIRESLGHCSRYTIHMDFPVTRKSKGPKYPDLAIAEWGEGPPDPSKRRPLCFVEFKNILSGNNSSYNIKAVENDCAKLLQLAKDNGVNYCFMCVVIRRKNLSGDALKQDLEKKYNGVKVLVCKG